ncbi:MAG: hypothetical protein LBD06_02150 [Candidatus Accumulibacter sp.]|nr:hypothetical protein [Accumulibacter sp.]
MRGQKTGEFAALRADQKTETRALGFSFFTRREAPQTHLSSVPYPLSSETVICLLK